MIFPAQAEGIRSQEPLFLLLQGTGSLCHTAERDNEWQLQMTPGLPPVQTLTHAPEGMGDSHHMNSVTVGCHRWSPRGHWQVTSCFLHWCHSRFSSLSQSPVLPGSCPQRWHPGVVASCPTTGA